MSDKKNNTAKGFAGLGSMVSEIDNDLVELERIESSPKAAPTLEKPATTPPSTRPQAAKQNMESGASERPRASGWKWALIAPIGVVGTVLVGLIYIGTGRKETPPPKSSSYSPTPAYSTAPVAPAPAAKPSFTPPTMPARTEADFINEERPPVGNGRVFNASEIRYCLSEKIRLEGMKGLVDRYSQASVRGFNSYVSDYNTRCSHFKYRDGLLEEVKRGVQSRRKKLRSEGVSRALENH
ncbi:MAG: hypothetical protein NTV11_00785 [Rhodocyclales bacterium]|nr:hypothetical protein [Rhodocyclales bacterium]